MFFFVTIHPTPALQVFTPPSLPKWGGGVDCQLVVSLLRCILQLNFIELEKWLFFVIISLLNTFKSLPLGGDLEGLLVDAEVLEASVRNFLFVIFNCQFVIVN